QAVLWAISPNAPPPELAGAVNKIRDSGELKADLGGLRESFRAPGGGNAENQFKNSIFNDERRVASMLRILEEELDNLKKAGESGRRPPGRGQATSASRPARLENQLAYVYEYQSMLGQMRKEFPPRDPAVHGGWRLASKDRLQ